MPNDALRAIQADLIAASIEIEFIRSHFEMKDADFAVLRDHLDAIGRKVEEMGEATSSGTTPNRPDYAFGSACWSPSCLPPTT